MDKTEMLQEELERIKEEVKLLEEKVLNLEKRDVAQDRIIKQLEEQVATNI